MARKSLIRRTTQARSRETLSRVEAVRTAIAHGKFKRRAASWVSDRTGRRPTKPWKAKIRVPEGRLHDRANQSDNPTPPGDGFRPPVFDEVTTSESHKPLTEPLHKSGGRNNRGEVTSVARRRTQAQPPHHRLQAGNGIPATVATVEMHEPVGRIAVDLRRWRNAILRQPLGLKVGDTIVAGDNVDILPGNASPAYPAWHRVHTVGLLWQGRPDRAQRRRRCKSWRKTGTMRRSRCLG